MNKTGESLKEHIQGSYPYSMYRMFIKSHLILYHSAFCWSSRHFFSWERWFHPPVRSVGSSYFYWKGGLRPPHQGHSDPPRQWNRRFSTISLVWPCQNDHFDRLFKGILEKVMKSSDSGGSGPLGGHFSSIFHEKSSKKWLSGGVPPQISSKSRGQVTNSQNHPPDLTLCVNFRNEIFL